MRVHEFLDHATHAYAHATCWHECITDTRAWRRVRMTVPMTPKPRCDTTVRSFIHIHHLTQMQLNHFPLLLPNSVISLCSQPTGHGHLQLVTAPLNRRVPVLDVPPRMARRP
jgi:hypothetical protein